MINLNISKKLFNTAYLPYLNNKTKTNLHNKPTQIFFGGSSSGKSVFLAQRAVLDVADGGRNYLILRKVQRDCRKSTWNEVIKQIKKFKLWDYVETNKTEMTITFRNGYQIIFGGLDDRERIKGITPEKGVITDIWLEEATEFEADDYKQLTKRLRGKSNNIKRITLSFNPIIQSHWIYRKFFNNWNDEGKQYIGDKVSIFKTTYKDNEHLTEQDIERLLDESDEYYIEVYIKGNWGTLGGVIFNNWKIANIDDLENKLERDCNGLDFGFSNDPAAVIKQKYKKSTRTLYIFDEIYQTGLTDPQLAEKTINMIGSQSVICDSAEPKSITQLGNHGVYAIGADKGPGSIETSYRWLLSINIVVHPRCVNTIKEFRAHKWKTDKDGNAKPKPKDKDNHAIDAIRYGTNDYWSSMGEANADDLLVVV